MKHILLTTIAAVVLVGCGESQQSATQAEPVEPVAEDAQPEPSTAKAPDISIHEAAYTGNIEAVKQHLAAGTNVNAKSRNGETPLLLAANRDHKEIVELLIAKGADVNVKDKVGWTPLHSAVGQGHKEIAELLIAKGADMEAKDVGGLTPLHFSETKEIAELLIANGANVNSKSNKGWTPLYSVALGHWMPSKNTGFKEVAELLIANGADVNAKNDRNRTPLHNATLNGRKEIVELLIAAGADVNAKANSGTQLHTPLDVTIKQKHAEIADLLRKHGGKTGEELKAEGK